MFPKNQERVSPSHSFASQKTSNVSQTNRVVSQMLELVQHVLDHKKNNSNKKRHLLISQEVLDMRAAIRDRAWNTPFPFC